MSARWQNGRDGVKTSSRLELFRAWHLFPIVQFEMTEGRYSAREASIYAEPNDPIDFAEKIVELLADDARCVRMGEIGRRRVENELVWSYEAPKLIAAYAHIGRG